MRKRPLPPPTAAAILIGIYLIVTLLLPRPVTVKPEGWRLTGLFFATIAGLILQPIPGGALVLIAIGLSIPLAGLTPQRALSGFADPVVWLVLSAFFISSALIRSGLARRIALGFVRMFGQTSLGVCYSLGLTDLFLATIIPSAGARSGGVVLPIVRSVAEIYGSRPGETASRIGSFLMLGVYQAICISSATLLTAQASNALAARMSAQFLHYPISWVAWARAGIVPGLVSMAIVPWVVYHLYPPDVRRTPEAAEFARAELLAMGRMSRKEWIVCAVFVGVCSMWIFSTLDASVAALLGTGVLLATGVLDWQDIASDRAAWDVFVWYGGLFELARALGEAGITQVFATAVGGALASYSVFTLFFVALLIYFFAHYGFASITAHTLAMFPAFAAVMFARGVPPGLAAFSLACFGNLCACLTNYGTTPAPMFFAQGYVPFATWWRIGFVVSLVTLTIWSTIGFGWWKVLGIW
ncbi:MAG TPA: DASS family sodium-coupled anion symporter [Bryobacteraceae bacterium]|nr:DASS family sodium-coupled anion symporter [Bryobacteraceae bacterium]